MLVILDNWHIFAGLARVYARARVTRIHGRVHGRGRPGGGGGLRAVERSENGCKLPCRVRGLFACVSAHQGLVREAKNARIERSEIPSILYGRIFGNFRIFQ